jgi:Tol biopolymer transport system component
MQPGTRLGPYEIVSLLGAGGMGEVYRARDTRLDRSVAVKVLAPGLASDADFRARFAREAKAISALNHAHICGLYDIGQEHDTEYLVLELLEGETLAARLARGPLPLTQVLRFGIEIADALEAAHKQGIVHRDLKPGNVMLTSAGTKLLDFGLAKNTTGHAGQALSELATAPRTATAPGAIVGTLPYMAPEQVNGALADARTDIFALGTILYEMATGRRAFEAKTQAGLIAKILETDVPAVSMFAPLAPPALDHIVRNCTSKQQADRWQTAHDVKLELLWVQGQGSRTDFATPPNVRRGRWVWVPSVIAALAIAGLVAGLGRPAVTVSSGADIPAQLETTLPAGMAVYDQAEISPDGRRLVFSASVNGRTQLFMRDLGSKAVVGLDDTEGAFFPFWSPDSRSIAFFAMGKLKQIGVTGGPARVLTDAKGWTRAQGNGTWAHGTIIFAVSGGTLVRVPDTGGTATPVGTLRGNDAVRAAWPRLLPDGRHVVFSQHDDPGLYVASLDMTGIQQLAQHGSHAVYAAGHLIYLHGARVFARPFDAAGLEFIGPETEVAEQVAFFSVSENGTIILRPERANVSRLTWFDRRGRRTRTLGEPAQYRQVVLSMHERRATVVRPLTQGIEGNWDLWDVDLTTGILSRMTTDPALDSDPSWSPDERHLAFTSRRAGPMGVFLKDVVSGAEEPLVAWKEPVMVDQWTPDGRFIIFRNSGRGVWAVPVAGDRTPRMLIDTPYWEDEVHVSPDGRWVAYNADESGRWEVYVARFPDFTSKRQISSAGGVQPQWSGDGRELFYLGLDGSMTDVHVTAGPEFVASAPAFLFATHLDPTSTQPQYGVSRDGQRFLGLEQIEAERNTLTVLVNWLNAKSADGSGPER